MVKLLNLLKFRNAKRVVQFVLVLFIIQCTYPLDATTYYVSNTGMDSNAGTTPETAWRTISKVNKSKFAPGDQILFKRGGNWREQLIVSSSGAAGNPIVFGAYDSGSNPVIDGADMIIAMTSAGSNIWQKTGVTIQPNMMYLNGTVGIPQTSVASCDTIGQWYWDSGTKVFSVYSASDPSGKVELGQRKRLVDLGSRQFITLSNLTIQHSNESSAGWDGAVRSTGGSNISMNGCTVQKNGFYGVYLLNTSNVTLDNNTFTRSGENNTYAANVSIASSIPGSPGIMSNIIFSNNEVHHSGEDGVRIWATPNSSRVTNVEVYGNNFTHNAAAGLYFQRLQGAVAYNNTFDSNGDSTHVGEDYAIGIQSCDTTDIYQNIITNQLNNDAIQLYSDDDPSSGSAHNVRIFGNFISRVTNGSGIGIALMDNETANNVQVYYNVIEFADKMGINLFRGGSGTSSSVDIFNNTLYKNARGFWAPPGCLAVIKNNIFFMSTNYESVHNSTTGELTTSNNLYYRISGRVLSYNGTAYSMATITNFEASAKTGDPLFTDVANRDFSLQTGSSAINAGVDVGLTRDILGNPIVGVPDIGAYEWQPKILK